MIPRAHSGGHERFPRIGIIRIVYPVPPHPWTVIVRCDISRAVELYVVCLGDFKRLDTHTGRRSFLSTPSEILYYASVPPYIYPERPLREFVEHVQL